MKRKLKVLQPRTCGACNACCHVLAIQEIDKRVNEDCVHLDRTRKEHHCTIYDRRPRDCREYLCAWVREGGFGDDWHRPDKIGVLFTPRDNKWEVVPFAGEMTLVAHETRDGAFEEPNAQKFMRKVAGHFLVFGFLGPTLSRARIMGPADKLRAVFQWCAAQGHDQPTLILKGEQRTPARSARSLL